MGLLFGFSPFNPPPPPPRKKGKPSSERIPIAPPPSGGMLVISCKSVRPRAMRACFDGTPEHLFLELILASSKFRVETTEDQFKRQRLDRRKT